MVGLGEAGVVLLARQVNVVGRAVDREGEEDLVEHEDVGPAGFGCVQGLQLAVDDRHGALLRRLHEVVICLCHISVHLHPLQETVSADRLEDLELLVPVP